MAKTVRTKIFQFNELDAIAQKKAIEHFHDLNVDHEWWELNYEYFASICELIGVEVDIKNTHHSGFYNQGSGAAVTADIDLKKLVEGIAGKVWEDEHGIETTKRLRLQNCPVDKRVLRLIYAINQCGRMNCEYSFKASHKGNNTFLRFACYLPDQPNISGEIDKLETWLKDVANSITNFLYRLLEEDYDYLTGEEAIKESIVANGYWFTKEGRFWPAS